MGAMIRLFFWLLLLPIRMFSWTARRLYVVFSGYGVLRLKLRGALPDRRAARGLYTMLSGSSTGPALLDVLIALERARRDRRIRTVLVEVGPLRCGLARAEEIRRALTSVREAGKTVIAFMEQAGLAEYSAALGAGEIWIAPVGGLHVTGVASEVFFLKGALDRAGVVAWLKARGEYKSARETFAEDRMTDANREMTSAIVDDLYDQIVSMIALSRGLDEAAIRQRLDEGPFTADEARDARLIDRVGYLDELENEVEQRVPKAAMVDLDTYLAISTHLAGRGRRALVALVEIGGHIKSGRSAPGADGTRATGSLTLVRQIDRLAKDRRVRAVVLRVDSPGGSALASDLMWRSLEKLNQKKPVVVSMANVAASGGYYVCGIKGVPIFASSSTITGSIGVLAGKFEARGLYDKLGIKKELVARGKHAAYYSEYRGYSEDELHKLERELDFHYRSFVAKMADGRKVTFDELDRVARGRVWTGRQALDNGLVDAQGGLIDALARVRQVLALPDDARLHITATSAERRRFPIRLEWHVPESLVPPPIETLFRLSRYFAGERILAVLPFDLHFE